MGLELPQGALVYALRQSERLGLFPINPLTLATYREAFTPSHAKDDPTDAERQLELLLKHRDNLTPLDSQSPAMRALEPRVEHRRRLVGDNVRRPNRLTSALNNDFPHVLQWFDATATTMCCDFLAQWPPLKAVQLARRTTLEDCFRAQHARDVEGLAHRIRAITRATPLTTEAGRIAPHARLVQALVRQLRVTVHALATVDHAIAQRAQSHPAFPVLAAVPGAGPVFAPRLLVAFGEQRHRDPSADELQK